MSGSDFARSRTVKFAVRGVLRFVREFARPRRRREVFFEMRIVVIDAASERTARAKAHRLFKSENRSISFPDPEVARESVTYLGISRVVEFGPEMNPQEVWWEFVDAPPRVEERPPMAAARQSVRKARR